MSSNNPDPNQPPAPSWKIAGFLIGAILLIVAVGAVMKFQANRKAEQPAPLASDTPPLPVPTKPGGAPQVDRGPVTPKRPSLPEPDAQAEADFQKAVAIIEGLRDSVLDRVESGALPPEVGEEELKGLQGKLEAEEKRHKPKSPESRRRYQDVAVTLDPKDAADIFAYRRAEIAFAAISSRQATYKSSAAFAADLNHLADLINAFKAVIEAAKSDTRKSQRIIKALSRLADLQGNTLMLAQAADELATKEKTAAAKPTPKLPVGSVWNFNESPALCPYPGCPSNGEHLHYRVNGRYPKPGDIVTCQKCGKQFRWPNY